MVWLKACPRCQRGGLKLDSDMYGKFVQCVQCGFIKELNPAPLAVAQPIPTPGPAPVGMTETKQPVAA